MDKRRAYIITFDTPSQGIDGLHKAIDDNKQIVAWWHYISNAYLVISHERATTIYNTLSAVSGGVNMLIIEVDQSGSRQGWLPDKAWKWINDHLSPVR